MIENKNCPVSLARKGFLVIITIAISMPINKSMNKIHHMYAHFIPRLTQRRE